MTPFLDDTVGEQITKAEHTWPLEVHFFHSPSWPFILLTAQSLHMLRNGFQPLV